MRPTRLAALVASLALVAGAAGSLPGTVRADDRPGDRGGERAGEKAGEKSGEKSPGRSDVHGRRDETAGPTRAERARKIVQELETTLTILRAAKSADSETLRALERALEEARRLAEPVTLAELTADERKAITEELRKELGETKEGPAAPNPLDDWRQRALASAFKDAGLAEDEEIEATKILQDWFQRSETARLARDSKAMSDLKGERDKSLEKALGRKKAQRVINNLNALSGWKR